MVCSLRTGDYCFGLKALLYNKKLVLEKIIRKIAVHEFHPFMLCHLMSFQVSNSRRNVVTFVTRKFQTSFLFLSPDNRPSLFFDHLQIPFGLDSLHIVIKSLPLVTLVALKLRMCTHGSAQLGRVAVLGITATSRT